MEFKFGLNRYHFRCPNCLGILSAPVAMIEGATAGLGLTGWLLKKSVDKTLKVESVGNSKASVTVGAEFSFEELGEMKESESDEYENR
jgi:hypothetical protein